MVHDDDVRETPPTVIAAVAAGTAPLPFLAVYAVLFIVHGGFHHVVPPDITNSNRGELVAGIVALVAFVVAAVTLLWLLNGRRRWPFVIVQAVFLATGIDFLVDSTKGGVAVSGLVAAAALVGLVLAAHPQVWEYVGRRCPRWLAALFGRREPRTPAMPVGSAPAPDAAPRSRRLIGRRRG